MMVDISGRRCTACNETKSLDSFAWRSYRGQKRQRSVCIPCRRKEMKGYRAPAYERYKAERARGERLAHWIWIDTRRADRKLARENDLDAAFIETAIAGGYRYCGETTLRMTLDRIDNRLGHTKDNVVGACIRRNLVRRDMSYEAWLILVPSVRDARERGAFGEWTAAVNPCCKPKCLERDSNPQPSGFEPDASADWAT